MPIYTWNKGSHQTIDAEVFAQRYDYLRQQHEYVTAETVVADAKARLSPIHAAFEWDNRVAGHAYRLTQARQMLASLRVLDEPISDELKIPTRYLVALTPTEPQASGASMRMYVPLAEALQDEHLREEVLTRALGELRAFQAKYREVSDLAKVLEVISDTLEVLSTQTAAVTG